MKHYILVRWKPRDGEACPTLVNLHKIVTVVGARQGCKIHFQGYCLDVEDSFSDVLSKIERAETEGSRKPADRPLMGTAARERQGKHVADPFAFAPSFDDACGGVTPYERTAPQAAPHERRRDPEGVPSGEGPEETAEDPGG